LVSFLLNLSTLILFYKINLFLQDIEEDLDLLNLNQKEHQKSDLNSGKIKFLEKRLVESESKNEELVEMVGKLKKMASNLLEKSLEKPRDTSDSSSDDEDDSVYVNSYSNYSIHLEMLQVIVVLSKLDRSCVNHLHFFLFSRIKFEPKAT
jgi:hypothetical protein